MTAVNEVLFAQGYDLTAFSLVPQTVAAATGVLTAGTPISLLLFHKESNFSNNPELVQIENSTQTASNNVTRRNTNFTLQLTEVMKDDSGVAGGGAVPSILFELAGPNATSDLLNAIWTQGGVVYDFIGRMGPVSKQSISGENVATLTLVQVALTGRSNPTATPNA